jgi:hypothetical protein
VSGLTLEPVAAEPAAGRGASGMAWLAAPAAATLSLLAAWSHFAYMFEHFRDWWAYGLFFLAMGVGQGLFAAALLRRPRHGVVLAGLAGNLAIVGMYILSRTSGIPLGPHTGVVERAYPGDLITTAGEIALVVLLLVLAGSTARRWVLNLLVAAGLGLWALRITGYLA